MSRNAVVGAIAAVIIVVAVGISFVGGGSSDGSSEESAAPSTTLPVEDATTEPASAAGPTECAPVGAIPEAEGKPTTVDAPTEPTTGDV